MIKTKLNIGNEENRLIKDNPEGGGGGRVSLLPSLPPSLPLCHVPPLFSNDVLFHSLVRLFTYLSAEELIGSLFHHFLAIKTCVFNGGRYYKTLTFSLNSKDHRRVQSGYNECCCFKLVLLREGLTTIRIMKLLLEIPSTYTKALLMIISLCY